jgi:hypothetical protein
MLVRFRQELKRCHGARALIYSLQESKQALQERPLLADIVEKLENREAPKISQVRMSAYRGRPEVTGGGS